MQVIKIQNVHLNKAAETLHAAFAHDPFILWMFDNKENYLKNGRAAFKTWIKWAMLYGIAIATPDLKAVALRKKPGKHNLTFWSLFRSGMLKTPSILGPTAFKKLMLIDDLFKAEQHKKYGIR